ncbi:MAG TPA: hypothetical protein VF177_11360 [Anaerolineae bacterium]
MSYKWIRASEISDYVYCRRSWWLKRVRGYTAENVRELAAGTRYHQQHGRMVQQSTWLRYLAYIVLFIIVAFITFQLFVG